MNRCAIRSTTAVPALSSWVCRSGLLVIPMLLAACAGADVTIKEKLIGDIPRPGRILVYDFAVTPEEVALDRGLVPRASRPSGSVAQTEEEVAVGHAIAKMVSEELVKALRDEGIVAYRAKDYRGRVTPGMAEIHGQFLGVDQGDRTKRTLIGFGSGSTEIRTRVEGYVYEDDRWLLIAEAYTSSHSALKPGMVVNIGAALIAGPAIPLAVGGVSAVTREALNTLKSDAKNTAREIAEVIREGYVRRGWLPE